MDKLTTAMMIRKIAAGETFRAMSNDGAFTVIVEEYQPVVCTAIHAGGNMREQLQMKCNLSKFERWQEEDPHTEMVISAMPIQLIAHDSRYEYDLNRPPEQAIYDEAWGKKVWHTALTQTERRSLRQRHDRFYSVLDALMTGLHTRYPAVMVIDMHSYNYKRNPEVDHPLFNLGTENIDRDRFQVSVDHWLNELAAIKLRGVVNRTAENDAFFGRGYLLKHLTSTFPNTLVLATEIKKVYCNERTGDIYHQRLEQLQKQMKLALVNQFAVFTREELRPTGADMGYQILKPVDDSDIRKTDRGLYRLARSIDVLRFVNPINIEAEKRKFLRARRKRPPQFRYAPLPYDAIALKRNIFELPFHRISDVHIRELYEQTIESTLTKIDLLRQRNTRQFLYNSLKLYQEPTPGDMANARFLMHLSDTDHPEEQASLTAAEAAERVTEYLKRVGVKGHIEISKNLTSKMMVVSSKKTLKIRSGSQFSEVELQALLHHEIGIHLFTTLNALDQDLKVFGMGLPGNTETQEGLAVFSEFATGHMTVARLKTIALRVIAIRKMILGADFVDIYEVLTDDYGMDREAAFYLATRVFRGGGFSKDVVYLRGFMQIRDAIEAGTDIQPLMIGKTSMRYLRIIRELTDRGLVQAPTLLPEVLKQSFEINPTMRYLIESLKSD